MKLPAIPLSNGKKLSGEISKANIIFSQDNNVIEVPIQDVKTLATKLMELAKIFSGE